MTNLLISRCSKGRCRTRPLLALVLLIWSVATQGAPDISGAEDIRELERYPLSYIVEYQKTLAPQYRLALGAMQKVNGVLLPEKESYIEGQLTRVTYRIPPGRSSREAFEYVSRQVEELPHEVLFECQGRACGSSSAWANNQFQISKLYGIDREQYYRVVRVEKEVPVTLVIYAVQRGNRRVYLHIDVIRPEEAVGVERTDAMLQQLLAGERVMIAAQEWEEAVLDDTAAAIRSLFRQRPRVAVWLVGHRVGPQPVVRLRNDAQVQLDRLKQELVGRGIDEHRLKPFSVGPLAPAYDSSIPENRIELIVE